ncbi:hypothetical protein Q4R63_13435, partial [Morganella morganii]
LAAEKAALEKQVAGLKSDNAQAEKNLALLQDKNADMAKVMQKLTELENQVEARDAEKQRLTEKLQSQETENGKQSA